MSKRLFVTGASGFVGSWIKTLHETNQLDEDLHWVTPNETCDIRDIMTLRRQIRKAQPDWIIHLAAQSSVSKAFINPEETIRINILGTLTLLKALKAENFQGRLLYVGSADSYGQVQEAELPVSEKNSLAPRNPYAVSKAACELLCQQWILTEGMDILIARPFNHIGPGQKTQFSIASFAKQVAEISLFLRPPVIEVGDIDTTRDFSDVRDIVMAYIALLKQGRAGETYNVCSGREQSIRNLLLQLFKIAGIDAEIIPERTRFRPADMRRLVGDNTKITRATGWKATIPIEITLTDTLSFWKEFSQHE